MSPASPRNAGQRIPAVDMARGAALCAMVVYHSVWNLNYVHLINIDILGAWGWWLFARLIAGSFLFLTGVSLILAHETTFRARAFFQRLIKVAAAAALITGATFALFPQHAVVFGVLHHIALASVLGLLFVRIPLWCVSIAALVSALLPSFASAPAFNAPAFWALGLATTPPSSVDYVPLFPGFAAVLAGIIVARLGLRWHEAMALLTAPPPARALSRGLIFGGRHSLVIYLLHPPILFGAATLIAQVLTRSTI